jgi:hypothetical protein
MIKEMIKERRTRVIKILFTETKYKELKERSKEKGMTLKQYILNHFIQE